MGYSCRWLEDLKLSCTKLRPPSRLIGDGSAGDTNMPSTPVPFTDDAFHGKKHVRPLASNASANSRPLRRVRDQPRKMTRLRDHAPF